MTTYQIFGIIILLAFAGFIGWGIYFWISSSSEAEDKTTKQEQSYEQALADAQAQAAAQEIKRQAEEEARIVAATKAAEEARILAEQQEEETIHDKKAINALTHATTSRDIIS